MSTQYPGGFISKSPTLPNGSTASGMWTLNQQAAYRKANLWPYVPGAPTSVSASATGTTTASVSFVAPSDIGSTAITSYTVTSSPGNITSSGASSPITITGLTTNTAYTFTVRATNGAGSGPPSSPSSSITTLAVPGAPTNVSASTSPSQATVSFTAPSFAGVPASITGYRVTSNPGGITATGASSPITILSGLSGGTSYTFTVAATNSTGYGPESSASNSITTPPQGQQAYTTNGTFTFVVPAGVTQVCAVCVGRGADGYRLTNQVGGALSGGGGALSYSNNIAVTPGESLTVSIDYSFSTLSRGATALVKAEAGKGPFDNPSYSGGRASVGVGNVRYSGGSAYPSEGSGGGAAGYAGDGGSGAQARNGSSGGSGTGGGGGGGGSQSLAGAAPSGGGVGILGQGASGNGGGVDAGGSGGSSGGNGGRVSSQISQGPGGSYGGGGGGSRARFDYDPDVPFAAAGGPGAVRIIWGPGRAFPSTNTGNV